MRVVLQRVSRANVVVGGAVVGEIEEGLVVLVAFSPSDTSETLRWMANKLWGLRIFPDDQRRMQKSALDIGGSLLIVSQFTLYGDARRGRRPSFSGAARPEHARELYDEFVELCRSRGHVETGKFGAMMDVRLTNDGPVTLVVDR